MNDFEKAEKLRERANVSFEEAKAALEMAGGDILDAMIILENQGKVEKPGNSSYSTKYEDSIRELPAITSDANRDKKSENGSESEFARKAKVFLRKFWVNHVSIDKDGKNIIRMPLWIFTLIVLLGIEIIPIVIVVSLFLGFKYSFGGEDELKLANEAAAKAEKVAGDIVDVVKEEYNKL